MISVHEEREDGRGEAGEENSRRRGEVTAWRVSIVKGD